MRLKDQARVVVRTLTTHQIKFTKA